MGKKEQYKALFVTISGTYINSKKEIVDFQNVKGFIPHNDSDIAFMHIRSRFAPMWIIKDNKYRDRLQKIREVFFDTDPEEAESDFSFVGKDIKELNWEELQDLAVAYDLRRIPLYKKTGLRQAQVLAYVDYCQHILGKVIDYKSSNFDFVKLPKIILEFGHFAQRKQKITNEQVIAAEQLNKAINGAADSDLTLEDLQKMATGAGIPFTAKTSYDELYNALFKTAAVG